MATPVIMPKQGQSVETCIITEWHKQKGDTVQKGDLLFSYETDKASFEEEAPVDGTLLETFFAEDDDVPVLTNVCVIGEEGENTDEFRPDGSAAPAETPAEEPEEAPSAESAAAAAAAEPAATEAPAATAETTDTGRIKISPRARALADKSSADYRFAQPTGPDGRIIERDIVALLENGPMITAAAKDAVDGRGADALPEGSGIGGRITTDDLSQPAAAASEAPQMAAPEDKPAYEDVKLSNMRKTIAKAMHQSLASTAQLTMHSSFDATDVLAYRQGIKAKREALGLANININDIVLYAVSRTLLDYRDLNAHFLDTSMRLFNVVNLGIAVDTERGLMVPTLFNADRKSLNQISQEARVLYEGCQSGSISPDYLTGGTFTITNLGTLDVEYFTPVLNPPQTGILGVNTIVQKAKEVDGEMTFYPSMGLSLTIDHRAVDGAPAARFLKALKQNLENFTVLLAK